MSEEIPTIEAIVQDKVITRVLRTERPESLGKCASYSH